MRIANNAEMLTLRSKDGVVYPTLAWGEKGMVLFDTGYPNTSEVLFAAMAEADLSPNGITKIVLTHQDIDHIGNIKEVIKKSPDLEVMAHAAEALYIQGYVTPVKLAAMELRLPTMDEAGKKFYESFKKAFANRRSRVDILLHDDELLNICKGLRVIHLPGHTPGHIGIFMEETGILVAGDALNIIDGKLLGSNPKWTQDMDLAQKSLAKLDALDIKQIVTYHGGLYKNETGKSVSELLGLK